jgi:hypothetical protein
VEEIPVEEFLISPQLQRSVRDNIQSIQNNLDILPVSMYEGFINFGMREAKHICHRIAALENPTNNNPPTECWTVIWEIATITTEGGLWHIARDIQETVIPCIVETLISVCC